MLVNVCKEQERVILEFIEHAVAVVRINVNVRYPLYAVFLARLNNRDTNVVKNAKAAGRIAPGVVQPRDWHERALCLSPRSVVALHYYIQRGKGGPDNV